MQLIAMLTMLIDHIGIVLFPGSELWRIIGRIAFPLYAYGIVQGFQHTSSRPKYIHRLLWLSAASQIPFMVALQSPEINVISTFAFCLIVLCVLDRLESRFVIVTVTIGALIALEWLPFNYGGYALLLILIYRYKSSMTWPLYHAALNLAAWIYHGWTLQLYSIVPTILLAYGKQMRRIAVPRWLWRSFYPAHLAALALIVVIRTI